MGFLTLTSIFILWLGVAAYFRISRFIWAPVLLLWLADLQYFSLMPALASYVFWPITATLVIVAFIRPVRQWLITKRLFHFFKTNLPPLSDTEKAAIESGTVAWEGKLFQGNLKWSALWDMPTPSLTDTEQYFLDNQVEDICRMTNDWEITHEKADLPKEIWGYLKKHKFFGMNIPKEYGGLGFSAYMHSCVISKLASKSVSLAVTTMVPNSLGPAELLMHYGTQEQKQYYLPRLANGEEVPCFALTAPEAGSDAGSIPDKGVICKGMHNGEEVLGIQLQFDKRYITLAPVATLVGLAFKLYDPDHLLGDKTSLGITLAMVPYNHPGVEIGTRHNPLRMAFMNGPIRGKDVFIPLDWVIGGVDRVGQGWRMLFECLSVGRGISLPALSTAMGALAYVTTGAYATVRRQFNMPISKFEGVEEALSRIAGFAYQLEASRSFTAATIDQNERPAVATAIAKYHMTELARIVNNDAMDVHAGRGIMMGPSNYLANAYHAMPLNITVEGANILTRSLMIFGQGAIRCHPYIKQELIVLDKYKDNARLALKHFDKLCSQHIGYGISNFVRTLFLALTSARLSSVNGPEGTKRLIQHLNRMSTSLAFLSDIAMLTLGGELKRKERLSARLGDMLSYLYLSMTVLKQYHQSASQSEEINLVNWNLQYNLYQIQEAFYDFADNYPKKALGWCLKKLVFPFGRSFKKPSDGLSQSIARDMCQQNSVREQFVKLCFIGDLDDDPVGQMNEAFLQCLKTMPALTKVQQAIRAGKIDKTLALDAQCDLAIKQNIITQTDAAAIACYEVLRKKAIAVDEFPTDYPLGSEACQKIQISQQEEQSIL